MPRRSRENFFDAYSSTKSAKNKEFLRSSREFANFTTPITKDGMKGALGSSAIMQMALSRDSMIRDAKTTENARNKADKLARKNHAEIEKVAARRGTTGGNNASP